MRTIVWLGMAGYGHWIRLAMISPTGLLTLVGEGSVLVSLMLGVCALLPVGNGTPLFFDLHRFFIAIARRGCE